MPSTSDGGSGIVVVVLVVGTVGVVLVGAVVGLGVVIDGTAGTVVDLGSTTF